MSRSKLIEYMRALEQLDEMRAAGKIPESDFLTRRGKLLAEMKQVPGGQVQVERELLDEQLGDGRLGAQEHAMKTAELDQKQEADERSARSFKIGCGGALAILALVIGLLVWSANRPEPAPEPPPPITIYDRQTASRAACQDLVEQRLKSPATAEFSGWQTELVGTGTGSGLVWNTYGYVDAENSFGATIRNVFHCETRRTQSTDNYVTSLKFISER